MERQKFTITTESLQPVEKAPALSITSEDLASVPAPAPVPAPPPPAPVDPASIPSGTPIIQANVTPETLRARAETEVRSLILRKGHDEEDLPAGQFAKLVDGVVARDTRKSGVRTMIKFQEPRFEAGMTIYLDAPAVGLPAGNYLIQARVRQTDHQAGTVTYRYLIVGNAEGSESVGIDQDALVAALGDPRKGLTRLERVMYDVFDGSVVDPSWKPAPETPCPQVARFLMLDLDDDAEVVTQEPSPAPEVPATDSSAVVEVIPLNCTDCGSFHPGDVLEGTGGACPGPVEPVAVAEPSAQTMTIEELDAEAEVNAAEAGQRSAPHRRRVKRDEAGNWGADVIDADFNVVRFLYGSRTSARKAEGFHGVGENGRIS